MLVNPEYDPHSSLRLSLVRRKQMIDSYHETHLPYCHGKINQQFASTGKSFRIKNNSIKLNNSLSLSRSLRKTKSQNEQTLDGLLNPDAHRQDERTKSLVKSINDHADTVTKNDLLVTNMVKLREMKLLSDKGLYCNKMPGVIRVEHVYNDYHARETNPGYSRNKLGGFYTS